MVGKKDAVLDVVKGFNLKLLILINSSNFNDYFFGVIMMLNVWMTPPPCTDWCDFLMAYNKKWQALSQNHTSIAMGKGLQMHLGKGEGWSEMAPRK